MNLIINWLLYSLAIIFIAWLLPGIEVNNFLSASFVVVVLALINIIIKPLILLITLPINIITLGLFSLIINAFLLWLAGTIAPGFEVEGFWSALLGGLILSVLSNIIEARTKNKN